MAPCNLLDTCGSRQDHVRHRGLLLLLVGVTFICFSPTLLNGFVDWDDYSHIIYNDHIRDLSTDTVRWAFLDTAKDWIPLTQIVWSIIYSIWGLNPVGYHLMNNVVHALNAGVFFLLTVELLGIYRARTQQRGGSTVLTTQSIRYTAALAALFFAVHPLRVESVAWATEMKDVLSAFFGMLSALWYLKYAQARSAPEGDPPQRNRFYRSRLYWLSFALFCLSLFSKPMLVTLPALFLVLDWYPLSRMNAAETTDAYLEKVPYFVVGGLTVMMTLIAQTTMLRPLEETGITDRVLISLHLIMAYLRITVWPVNLSPFYLYPANISAVQLPFLLPILFFITVTAACLYLHRRMPHLLTLWLVYLMALLPILGFLYASDVIMADRYTYIPGLPFSILCASCFAAVYIRFPNSARRIALVTASVLVLLFNGYLTIRQISYWKDDIALWTRAIQVDPTIGRPYFHRGKSYAARGEYLLALSDINRAMEIALVKKSPLGMQNNHMERARIYRQMNEPAKALTDYSAAILIGKSSVLYNCYLERGELYRELGNIDLAEQDFQDAYRSRFDSDE